jgi:hypothetical protein
MWPSIKDYLVFAQNLLINEGVQTDFTDTKLNLWLVTVTVWRKACTVFAHSDTGIVGSNPAQGMNV